MNPSNPTSATRPSAVENWERDPEHRFTGIPLSVEYIDGITWELVADVAYYTKAGDISTVRAGFIFDWASTPPCLWGVCPPAGLKGQPYGIAAMFHDWVYHHKQIAGKDVARSQADDLFLEIMLYIGVASWRAHAMWAAVRTFGWWAWSHDKVPPAAMTLQLA